MAVRTGSNRPATDLLLPGALGGWAPEPRSQLITKLHRAHARCHGHAQAGASTILAHSAIYDSSNHGWWAPVFALVTHRKRLQLRGILAVLRRLDQPEHRRYPIERGRVLDGWR